MTEPAPPAPWWRGLAIYAVIIVLGVLLGRAGFSPAERGQILDGLAPVASAAAASPGS